MSKVSDRINAVIEALEAVKDDAGKVDNGMAGAPGRRVRKAAMETKKAMDEVRKLVLEARND